MNRKGVDFAAFMIIIAWFAIMLWFVSLASKHKAVGHDLGDVQFPVLKINSDVRFYQVFVREAGKLASQGAMNAVLGNPARIEGVAVEKGCVMLNMGDESKAIVWPSVQGAIGREFNKRMDGYLRKYAENTKWKIPSSDFELFVENNKVTGVAVRPTELSVGDGKQVGTAFFRPSFEVEFDTGVSAFVDALKRLDVVAASCSFQADPLVCARQKSIETWKVEKGEGDVVTFTVPQAAGLACFGLHLPATAEKVSA